MLQAAVSSEIRDSACRRLLGQTPFLRQNPFQALQISQADFSRLQAWLTARRAVSEERPSGFPLGA